jgi:hypothetical protein
MLSPSRRLAAANKASESVGDDSSVEHSESADNKVSGFSLSLSM